MKIHVLLSYENISILPHLQKIYYLPFIYEYDVGLRTADEPKIITSYCSPFSRRSIFLLAP
jgi:hypothetical protein